MIELLKTGLLNTVLGMGTVFIVLIFISFLISLFKYIPRFLDKFKPSPKKTSGDVNLTQPPLVVQQPSTVLVEPDLEELVDDKELVAVITAAIMAAANVNSADKLIVKSVRRASKRR